MSAAGLHLSTEHSTARQRIARAGQI